MSEYLFCITRSENPDSIEIFTALDDPREDSFAAKLRRREMGQFKLQWTLPVVDRALSEAALRKALHPHRDKSNKHAFACNVGLIGKNGTLGHNSRSELFQVPIRVA